MDFVKVLSGRAPLRYHQQNGGGTGTVWRQETHSCITCASDRAYVLSDAGLVALMSSGETGWPRSR